MHILCLLLCAFNAISLRRSSAFLPPEAAFLSLVEANSASKRSESRPFALTSTGRKGEDCLTRRGEIVGGGLRRAGL